MHNRIIIGTFNLPHELQILRSILESEGINCQTIDENTIQTDPLISSALGGVKLTVPHHQLREALVVKERYEHRKKGLDEADVENIDGEYLELKFLSEQQKKDISYAKSFLVPTIIITLIFVILSIIIAINIASKKQTYNEKKPIKFGNITKKNLSLCGIRY